MLFNETRLLDCVSYGSSFGREFSTRIIGLVSGHERRNANWSRPLGQYSIQFSNLKPQDHAAVKAAHMASMGSLVAFRFKDWTDYTAVAEPLGSAAGGAQTLQLSKSYAFGPITFSQPIFKPVAGTVALTAGGEPIAVTVDSETGMVSFTANPGDAIAWSGEYDVPVRFVSDRLDSDPRVRTAGGFILSSDVDLVEVRL